MLKGNNISVTGHSSWNRSVINKRAVVILATLTEHEFHSNLVSLINK